MACMTSEASNSPLAPPPITQKRCSLPGPMSSLNLYATHQQRRLSERGLMIYRPSKPDIDLIGDFINPNKKVSNSPSSSSGGLGSPASSFLPTIQSPSKSPTGKRKSSSPATAFPYGISELGQQQQGRGSIKPAGLPQTSSAAFQGSVGTGCRKVRIRMQKNPGGKENKFIEMQNIGIEGSSSSSSSPSNSPPFPPTGLSEESSLLRNPLFDTRRYSDSVTQIRGPTSLSNCLTPETRDTGIVCSTGDLRALKCLTSSAQEIRYSNSPSTNTESDMGTPTPESLGNRSRSFDATYTRATGTGPRKGIGSSWFSRRHLPISVKLPISLKSPSVPSSPGPNQLTLKAPILTVTNETSGQSELIEVQSPPSSTPVGDSPEEKTKVAWDNKTGFVVDAAVLGFVIESHLRKTDMKRRATVSTLYEPQSSLLPSQVPTRARSASAYVIPPIGASGPGQSSSTGRRGSLYTANNVPLTRLCGESRDIGEAVMIRREKRGSLCSGTASTLSWPEATRARSQSYVETMDTDRRANITKTTVHSSYLNPPLAQGLRTELKDLAEEEVEEVKGKRTSAEPGHAGLSICTAIRDFIIHSIRS